MDMQGKTKTGQYLAILTEQAGSINDLIFELKKKKKMISVHVMFNKDLKRSPLYAKVSGAYIFILIG